MPRYEYNGENERSFPSLGITVKKGDSFDGPAGLRAPGLSLASTAKTAPAVPTAPKEEHKVEVKEVKEETIKPSAPSDTTAGV
jgi:hypothetical protein